MTNKALLLILFTWFFGNLDIHFITPALPKLASSFSVQPNIAQLTISLFLLGKALSMIVWGILSERYGRKPIFIWGLLLYLTSNFLAALSPSIEALLLCRFFQGIAVGATLLMGRAMINDTHDEQHATQYFAWFFTLGGLFICFLPFLGGLINSHWSWQTASIIIALYALLLFPLSIGIQETKPNHRTSLSVASFRRSLLSFKEIITTVFRHPIFVGYLLISALMMAGESAFNTSASFILIKGAQWTSTQYGLAKTVMAIMHLLGTACCGILVKYYSSRQLTAFGVYFFAFSAVLMWLFSLLSDTIYLIFIIPMVVYYFGTGFIVASATSAVVRPFPKQMALALALTLFCQFNCSALFSFITSVIGIKDVSSFMCLLCLIGFFSLITLNRLKLNEEKLSKNSVVAQ
ncbi:MFS transporter [Legionella anisa]|uniref:MFS transporter n=1 Tax=Legionella anisa TaxID=28082 RepID=A0AAX0WTQ8_9GAMM|nr:MFS transporter [Legionella anisa]AWN74515.1 MFS transporter [Legionella anisa]KTC76579.1 drug resistance transporter, Bcr/CflA [Legionella anisa]MBN5935724.1 MFS transporter [Legionella anisa]MCW8425372.1 MFS transporter [Legionella anisa]MCW8449197.1 MFS transporter [Legionella anisa]